MTILFNDNWEFLKTKPDTDYNTAMTSNFSKIDIPHDWLIYQVNDLYESSIGWYRKSFDINDIDKVHKLYFDGVYMDTEIYINNVYISEWKYGYSSFEVDITGKVNIGTNNITVKVNHLSPNSRWYSGAGIFRNIYFIEKDRAHLATNGVYFSAKENNSSWEVKLSSETIGTNNSYDILFSILDKDGRLVTKQTAKCNEEITFNVDCPNLWSCENPYLYTLKTELIFSGDTIDIDVQNVGFRTIKFTTDKGFFLNGKHVKLNGVCLHHDLGCLGAAFNKEAFKRQLDIMISMGVNAIRTSHNMPAREVMDLCDEMGILVNSEAFDMWELKKTDYDYARYFNEWYKKDVASWIRRDRNHPSIIMWSIGNEIYDTHFSERGLEITHMLCNEVKLHDYNHNGFTTLGSNYVEWEPAQKCSDVVEVSGYNYGEHLYNSHHNKYPHWRIYGSETASRVQSRNVYHLPKSAAYITHDDLQCSSLENCRAGITDRTAQTSIIADRDTEFSAGQFIWTGFDYIGEPSPYSTKNSYFGQVDTAGFPKDSYYLYKAAWTNEDVIHIMPYWDFNEGQLIDIVVYTNLYEVELIFNGKSLGRKQRGNTYSVEWQLPFKAGKLEAIGYNESGEVISTDIQQSFGDTAKLDIKVNKTELLANGTDLAFVEITALDENNVYVANAKDRVIVNVNGAGRLIGLDTGDSTDYDEYKDTSKRMFGGKLLAVIATTNIPGEITIEVSTTSGIKANKLCLNSISTDVPTGSINTFECNKPIALTNEIPVRKIELISDRQCLDSNNNQALIYARVLPEDATFTELEWSVVTNSGVKTNIADIEVNENNITLKALGDGELRLRCTSNNGKAHPDVISELEFKIEGLGRATSNPYEFIPASLYSYSKNQLNEVSNGGVHPQDNDRNIIGFKKLDFGTSGTDELTVSIINWHKDDEVYFSLWCGMPDDEASYKIGDYIYKADFVWQTYIDNTFKIPKKLKGVQDICFVFDVTREQRISFGGFKFTKENRAYSKILATENDNIYGDSFNIVGDEIQHIGNNVYMVFNELDFINGTTKVTLCGRTHNANDSIHLKFDSENTSEKNILEFPHSDDYIEKTFDIKNFKGLCNVHLTFLPGCDFDFKWIKFS